MIKIRPAPLPERVNCIHCELPCRATIIKTKKEIKCPCIDCLVKPICIECCDNLIIFSRDIHSVQIYT